MSMSSSPLPASALIWGAGLFTLLLAVYFLQQWFFQATKAASETLVLAGPVGSGKTALFSQQKLVLGQYRSTQTSVKPNIGFVTGKADSDSAAPSVRSIRLADVPGHERLRARFLSQYHASSSSVVLVIDASSGLSGRAIKEACDHLQLILALNASTQSRPSLAVFLSKCDLLPDLQSMNHQSIQDKAKSALQREMERRRLASSSTFGGRVEGLSQVVGQPRDEAEILAAHSAYTDAMWTWETRAADAHFMSASSSAEGDRIRKEFSDWQAASSVR